MAFIVALAMMAGIGGTPCSAQTYDKRIVLTPIVEAPSFAKYALVIGVTDYTSAMHLRVCGNDAAHFAALLKNRFGFENVVLMTDEPGTDSGLRPTERNIKTALQTMYDGIDRGKSEVVFFFSGHGLRAKDDAGNDADWLMPEDFNRRDIPGTCINYANIRERLDTLQPKRVLMITDACRELMGKGVGASGYGATMGVGELGPEVAELHSCLPSETSLEGNPADFNESVFTHYLIKALSGDPDAAAPSSGVITFDSLKEYVQFSVHAYAAKMNAVQTPDGRATLGAMVLARVDPSAAHSPALVVASAPDAPSMAVPTVSEPPPPDTQEPVPAPAAAAPDTDSTTVPPASVRVAPPPARPFVSYAPVPQQAVYVPEPPAPAAVMPDAYRPGNGAIVRPLFAACRLRGWVEDTYLVPESNRLLLRLAGSEVFILVSVTGRDPEVGAQLASARFSGYDTSYPAGWRPLVSSETVVSGKTAVTTGGGYSHSRYAGQRTDRYLELTQFDAGNYRYLIWYCASPENHRIYERTYERFLNAFEAGETFE